MKTNNSNGQMTAQVNLGNQQKSGFDLSNNVLGTGKLGRIYPTRALHVMPNDSLNNKTEVAVQFEPLAVPMLANMYVRQEHFYCPYNIVWKNWDKFISGGEKLDYKGVVPNVTMQKIVDVIVSNLIGSTNKIDFKSVYGDANPIVPGGFGTYFRFNSAVPQLESYRNSLIIQLEITGSAFGVDDILDEQREAIDNLNVFIDKCRDLGAGNSTFDGALFINFYDSDWDSFEDMWHAYEEQYHLTGTKYLESLKDWVKEKYEADTYVFLPTSYCLDFLICIYDYVKSFIGVGSIIDYLNMARMTFTDYLYIWLSSLQPISSSEVIPNPYDFSSNGFGHLFFSTEPLSILHLRANYSVWYNNYRDILLEILPMEPTDIDAVTHDELFTLLVPRQRCWNKDAFTTALDNPGTGNVGVPVGANTPYAGSYYSYSQDGEWNSGEPNEHVNNVFKVMFDGETWNLPTAFLSGLNLQDTSNSVLSEGFSLYQLDAAQRAQKWLQKALFFGNRISDFYYMRFGVRYLDARLRLPELLASSTQLVKLDVVMNNTNITTEAGGEIYQSVAGDRSAYASAFDNGDGYSRFCEEHGVVLSYLTIMPQPTYAYGRSRDYSRLDQFDFAFNEFATLGMDAVYDTEITSVPFERQTKIFGYQGRYYDYKAKHSEEHGELLESQDMYTFGRRFDMYSEEGAPKLNYAFVHCFPPLDMFVVDSKLADYFRFDMRHNTTCERLLPAQSIYI